MHNSLPPIYAILQKVRYTAILLTLLSPEIIHAIIAGTLEKDIGIEQLKQAMPLMWNDQKKMFDIE